MGTKRSRIGMLILVVLMVATFWILLRDMPLTRLGSVLGQLRPGWIIGGMALMLLMMTSEAACTRQILPCLGYETGLLRCLSYSFAGYYFSAITPSATGGQPAQVYCMVRDGVSAAHGTLNMLLLSMCYQVTLLLLAGLAAVLYPWLLVEMGGGMAILFVYGILVNVALTAGMLCLMFLPNAARKICSGVLNLLVKVRLVRNRAKAEEKLERQMEDYRSGAECLRRNPTLPFRLLGCSILQLGALFSVPYMVYRAFGLSGYGVLELLGAQALLTLAVGSLPLPGAVGASEGGFLRGFTLFFGAELVTPAVLVSRGISFYSFMVLSGVITLVVHLWVRRRNAEGPPACPKRARGPAVT